MEYYFNSVSILEAKACDDISFPQIKIKCEKIEEVIIEKTNIIVDDDDNEYVIIDVPLSGPIEIMKKLDTTKLYKFKIKLTKLGKIRICEIEELDIYEEDDDIPEPDHLDKEIIVNDILNKINEISRRKEDELQKLQVMKDKILNSKTNMSIIDIIHNDLNEFI